MIVHKVNPPGIHRCDPPYDPPPETLYGEGTIWMCDICGRTAKLVNELWDE